MEYLEPNKGLKVYDIQFDKQTAGPSPNDNKRIELFLLGCDRAMTGNACYGCFNKPLHDANKAEHSFDPIELADWIAERTPINERYITLGGGCPLQQSDNIILLCKQLKSHGFHIMMYTWRKLKYYLDTTKDLTEDLNIAPFSSYIRQRLPELLPYLDIVVDGEYIASERLYQGNKADGLLSSIGSGNQGIWDIQYYNKTGRHRAYFMRDIDKIKINEFNNGLIYYLKGECKPVWK
jgi:organic radical activating enzyme